MRVLLLSYYFTPDLGAGSFRAKALADTLVAIPGVQLDVITTEPNRYHSHKPDPGALDSTAYSVHRVVLPEATPGLRGQIRGFSRFALGAKGMVPGKQYDVVVATSSRLMTPCLG